MNENFLPLRRELRNHWVYTDSQYLHLWIEMLYSARFSQQPKTEVFKGVMYTINRGEFIFSRPSYSQRLNIPDNRVRKAVELLMKDNMIEVVSSLGKNKPTIYKIINYDLYNNPPSESVGRVSVQELSTKSTPSERQVDTKSPPLKKKEKKEKIEKKKTFGEHVQLTDAEIQKLNISFGESVVNSKIEDMNNYIASKGTKYTSHYSALLNWFKRDGIKKKEDTVPKKVDNEALIKGLRSMKKNLEMETEDGIEAYTFSGNEAYYHKCVKELRDVNERLRVIEEKN